ncbi:MAG: TlpA disulfide reductase family protein [Verrucomicrobiota bacterium]
MKNINAAITLGLQIFCGFAKRLWPRTCHSRITLVLCSLALALSIQSVPARLDIGDPAPELHPAKWIKGESITEFKTNQVYVVEFWATWCGPCKANIPHLTELAKKYGDQVAIAGISIWESTDPTDTGYIRKVVDFVKHEGDKMDYRVAVDGPQGDIANTWMKAAGENGIPASFIVGKDGNIAWIGHPAKLDEALQQVLDGKFDEAAARSQREADLATVRPLNDAMAAGDYPRALGLINQILARQPNLAPAYAYTRLVALYHTDVPAAIALSTQTLQEQNHDIGAYRMIASIFATQTNLTSNAYNYGQGLVDQALQKDEMKYLFLAMAADLRENLADQAGAAKYHDQAVAAAEKDVHAPAEFVESMKRKLAKLNAGL